MIVISIGHDDGFSTPAWRTARGMTAALTRKRARSPCSGRPARLLLCGLAAGFTVDIGSGQRVAQPVPACLRALGGGGLDCCPRRPCLQPVQALLRAGAGLASCSTGARENLRAHWKPSAAWRTCAAARARSSGLFRCCCRLLGSSCPQPFRHHPSRTSTDACVRSATVALTGKPGGVYSRGRCQVSVGWLLVFWGMADSRWKQWRR